MRSLAFLLVFALVVPAGLGGQERTRVERLGYPRDAKLLILHADDIGMAHSQNAASIAGFEAGVLSSGSVLVNAPWAAEFAAWSRAHPGVDVGVHLTLTAEWQHFRWPALLSQAEAPSLYDAEGFLPRTVAEVAAGVNAAEAEREFRAQIARARQLGLAPTHVDSHMYGALATPAIFEAYLRVAREAGLPAAIPPELLLGDVPAFTRGVAAIVRPAEVLVDRYLIIPQRTPPESWEAFYDSAFRSLEPGTITQLIVHPAYDDAEMRAITTGHAYYDAAWRQRDVDFLRSPAVQRLLEENGIQLITWRQLAELLPPPS